MPRATSGVFATSSNALVTSFFVAETLEEWRTHLEFHLTRTWALQVYRSAGLTQCVYLPKRQTAWSNEGFVGFGLILTSDNITH